MKIFGYTLIASLIGIVLYVLVDWMLFNKALTAWYAECNRCNELIYKYNIANPTERISYDIISLDFNEKNVKKCILFHKPIKVMEDKWYEILE